MVISLFTYSQEDVIIKAFEISRKTKRDNVNYLFFLSIYFNITIYVVGFIIRKKAVSIFNFQ